MRGKSEEMEAQANNRAKWPPVAKKAKDLRTQRQG
jgi:hypothetical protein